MLMGEALMVTTGNYTGNRYSTARAFRIAVLTAVMILIVLAAATVCAEAKPVQMHKKDTHTVIVGNSRVVGLWNSKYRTYSLIGSSGGQYTTNDNRTIQSKHYGVSQQEKSTVSKSRYTTIRNSIKAALKKHHKCRVVIFATINECRADRVEAEGVDQEEYFDEAGWSIVDFATKCRIKMKVRTTEKEQNKMRKQGKKPTKFMTVRAKVYVVQSPKAAEFEMGVNYPYQYVKKYNKAIRTYAKDEKYIDYVKLDREPEEEEFAEDGLHFIRGKSGYNAYIWQMIKGLKFE